MKNRNSLDAAVRQDLAEKGYQFSGDGIDCACWYGVLSSRLGQPVEKRQRWFQLLRRVVEMARRDDAALIVVPGTAAAPWIEQAASLYQQPVVRIDSPHSSQSLDPDQIIVAACDRLFVLRARKGGKVFAIVRDLLKGNSSTDNRAINAKSLPIRVAIWPGAEDAGSELLVGGAIGWYLYGSPGKTGHFDQPHHGRTNSRPRCLGTDLNWIDQQGPWLLHCTRARAGPLPGQPERQWRDEVVLGGEGGTQLGAEDVLTSIVSRRFLRGNPLANDTGPVVCLTELPLAQAISRRTFRPHRQRWDFEPFGIGLRKSKVIEIGGCPVVYGDRKVKMGLHTAERWKFQAVGTTYDWTSELEWRVFGGVDLSLFSHEDLFIFVPNHILNDINKFQTSSHPLLQSPWPIYPLPSSAIPNNSTA